MVVLSVRREQQNFKQDNSVINILAAGLMKMSRNQSIIIHYIHINAI